MLLVERSELPRLTRRKSKCLLFHDLFSLSNPLLTAYTLSCLLKPTQFTEHRSEFSCHFHSCHNSSLFFNCPLFLFVMALGVPYGNGLLFVSKIDYQFSGGKHFVLTTYTSSALSTGPERQQSWGEWLVIISHHKTSPLTNL